MTFSYNRKTDTMMVTICTTKLAANYQTVGDDDFRLHPKTGEVLSVTMGKFAARLKQGKVVVLPDRPAKKGAAGA